MPPSRPHAVAAVFAKDLHIIYFLFTPITLQTNTNYPERILLTLNHQRKCFLYHNAIDKT